MFIQRLFEVVQRLKIFVHSVIEKFIKSLFILKSLFFLTVVLVEQCDCSFLLKLMISVKDETSGGLSTNKGKEKVQE